MTNTHDPRLGEMGIPLACGGPLCGVDHHHPLCKLYAPGAVSTAPAAPVSAEPVDKGPWHHGVTQDGKRHFVQSEDFGHDVRLYIDGDFAGHDDKERYAKGIAAQLNAAPVAAQPDLTQQTLEDVQAGIPARDAEIETLRKENAELREQLDAIGAGGVSGKLMPGAVSAEPVAYYLCVFENGRKLGTEDKETAEQMRDIGWIPEPLYRRPAPVAAQPDVTQQTLDDVMAGIPARDAEIEALRKEIDSLRAQQPVSGADGLQADGALVADERELVALAVKHHIRFPRNRDLIAFIDEARASLAAAQPATQPQPSGNSGELPDAVRVPLDSLHADAVYLLSRVKQVTLSIHDAAQSIRSRIEATCAALAQQDANKVDAERWRAYRAAIAAEDSAFLGRAESYLSSLGLRAEVLPTEGQIDSAIDAALKEAAHG